MAKNKCECPKPGLTAPFYMLTYGDLMTLLLTFFVLLFAMSSTESGKAQSQMAVMAGAVGISKEQPHAPMQANLPAPSVRQSSRGAAHHTVKPTSLRAQGEYNREDLTEPTQHDDNRKIMYISALGTQGDLQIKQSDDEMVLVLPTYNIFAKGSAEIDPNNPEVQKAAKFYAKLGEQITRLQGYDIHFVGHTDTLPLAPTPGGTGPKDNTELGFLRAQAIYKFFFGDYLKDRTRIIFSSQGDSVPVVPNASLDSERRKNRRVEIRLVKKQQLY